MMNQNIRTDSEDRLEVSIPDTITIDGDVEISHPIVDLGGQDALVVVVANPGSIAVEATQSGSWDISVNNFPADPASGTNQNTANTRLADIKTATESTASRLPTALVSGNLPVIEANSTLIYGSVNSVDGKLPPSLGQKTSNQSMAVVLPSDGTLPLPSGASTSANQSTGNASLASIDGKLSGTLAVSAVSLPLPTGASTSANQSTGNASLSSIDGKTPALVSGRQPVDPSGVTSPVSIASLPLPSGAATEATLSAMSAKLPASLGTKTAANSFSVVLASDYGISPYLAVWPAGQLSPPGNTIPWIMTGAGGRPTGGQNWVPFATDTSGRLYSLVAGNNPTPDATTSVYSILLGTSGPSAITGAIVAKASAGRVKRIVVDYTGASGTVYVQIHKALSTGTATTSTLMEPGMPMGTGSTTLVFEPSIDLPCTTGIVIAFSSTKSTYTAAGAETGFVTVFGA